MKQTVLKVELRRTQYVLPPYAIAVLFCNILFSSGKNSFKQFIYDQLQLLGRLFFLNFKNYGSDGILSPSLLNQMIRKRLKLFKQSFCVGVSEYASHME